MNKFGLISLIVLLLLLFVFLINICSPEDKLKRASDFFYNSTINGEIVKVGVKYHYTYFKIKGDSSLYIFNPITESVNNNKVFLGFAKSGDTIMKDSKADTLILLKKNHRYKYRFEKFFR
jgi:hypothetical protein